MSDKSVTAALILGALVVLGFIVVLAVMPKEQTCPAQLPCPKCEPVVVTKEVSVATDYKKLVTDAFLLEVAADKDLRVCGGDKYDLAEVELKKVYDGFKVVENTDGDQTISDVKVKLDYDGGKCYKTFTCKLEPEQDVYCI